MLWTRQIDLFLALIGKGSEDLYDTCQQDLGPKPGDNLSRNTAINIAKGRAHPKTTTLVKFKESLQILLQRQCELKRQSDRYAQFLRDLKRSGISFLDYKGNKPTIVYPELEELYKYSQADTGAGGVMDDEQALSPGATAQRRATSVGRQVDPTASVPSPTGFPAPDAQPVAGTSTADLGTTQLEIELSTVIERVSVEQGERLLEMLRTKLKAKQLRMIETRSGSTKIVIEVHANQAAAILDAFANGDFGGDVVAVRLVRRAPDGWVKRVLLPQLPPVDLTVPDLRAQFSAFWRVALVREFIVAPWQRLRWLFSNYTDLSPLAATIAESERRAYARAEMREERQSLFWDLSMIGIIWPLLTALLLFVTLALIYPLYSQLSVTDGILTGVLLGLTGSQICSVAKSPICCGAGIIPMGWAFGLAHAIVIGQVRIRTIALGATSTHSDLFTAITGGLVGLSTRKTTLPGSITATGWADIPMVLQGLMLLAIPLAIAGTGWLMSKSTESHVAGGYPIKERVWQGAFCGSLAGGCIGLVYGINTLFIWLGLSQPAAFLLAFLSVALPTLSLIMSKVSDGHRSRKIVFAAAYALLACTFIGVGYNAAGTTLGFVGISLATSWYHSLWFTAAYVWGDKIGGVRAAVGASILEGAVGFTAFVIVRLFVG